MTSGPPPPAPTAPDESPPPSVARFVAIALSIAALALVALIAIVVAFGAPRMGVGEPPVCLEAYAPDTLANRSFAFDGTVAGIDGEDVTFRVERPFIGIETDVLTLRAPGMTAGAASPPAADPGSASPSEMTLVVGQRYLVAGDGGDAWGCGFTRPYDAATAAEWASVFALPPASGTSDPRTPGSGRPSPGG